MNITKTLSVALPLIVLPLLAFASREDKVSFSPAEGATVSKELSLEATFYVDDLNVVVDGQELPAEMLGAAMEEGMMVTALVGVTDDYVKTREGRQSVLHRTYDELTLEAGPESEPESVDDFAELEDSTVAFVWDGEADEYIKSFHESEGNEDVLENLEVDMDFLALLPDGEVSEGDTWEVSGDDLGNIFFPGGMPADLGGGEDENAEEITELVEEAMEEQMAEAFGDFAITCTYAGSRDEDGVNVGVITFKFESEASLDLSDVIQSVIDLQAGEQGLEVSLTATIGLEMEGEGTLLWNLRGSHVQGFEMSTDVTTFMDMEGEMDMAGQSHSMELSAEISGEAAWELVVKGGDDE
ncbi:MAG: hypothetical protein ACI8X5_000520 [Planctomycetota bacterium]|jgi:hypothetical protein